MTRTANVQAGSGRARAARGDGRPDPVVNYSIRLDADLRRRSEAIYSELGMTLSAAINAFLRQSVRTGGFPFELRLSPEQRAGALAAVSGEGTRTDDASVPSPQLTAVE